MIGHMILIAVGPLYLIKRFFFQSCLNRQWSGSPSSKHHSRLALSQLKVNSQRWKVIKVLEHFFNKLILQLQVTKWEKDVLIRAAVLPFIRIKGTLLMRRSSGIPGRHANKRAHSQTDTHWDALVKLACTQQQNDNSVVGYYEWEWAGFFRSWARNTSSLTCFAPHKHTHRTGMAHAYIPAHVNTETADAVT